MKNQAGTKNGKPEGAWLTDIDDTLIESGAHPAERVLDSIRAFIGQLSEHGILWVGMSGVSLEKIRRRLLDHLPVHLRSSMFYYAGDGSQKYYFETPDKEWREELQFSRIFSGAQAVALIGAARYVQALGDGGVPIDEAQEIAALAVEVVRRWSASLRQRGRGGDNLERPILDVLEETLEAFGFSAEQAALYYRGGSISWMILGDHSAERYREPHAARARTALIRMARRELELRDNLRALGEPVVLPFPGARGIKLVVEGNTKLRAVRDLMAATGLPPRRLIFAGNELYRGGNDNMLRSVRGLTLLSVGERVDGGSTCVVDGRLDSRGGIDGAAGRSGRAGAGRAGGERRRTGEDGQAAASGVAAMQLWMAWVGGRVTRGAEWSEILRSIRAGSGP